MAFDDRPEDSDTRSGLHVAAALVGDRWSLLVIAALLEGPRRFNELQEAIGDVAPNVLSKRLRQLEADRLVVALPYNERPLRHTYQLTARGADLADVVRLLAEWGDRWAGGSGDALDFV